MRYTEKKTKSFWTSAHAELLQYTAGFYLYPSTLGLFSVCYYYTYFLNQFIFLFFFSARPNEAAQASYLECDKPDNAALGGPVGAGMLWDDFKFSFPPTAVPRGQSRSAGPEAQAQLGVESILCPGGVHR